MQAPEIDQEHSIKLQLAALNVGTVDRLRFIKVFDLFNYVSEEVPKLIPDEQHPIFKADNLEVNFAVALSQGGKKSPYSPEIC